MEEERKKESVCNSITGAFLKLGLWFSGSHLFIQITRLETRDADGPFRDADTAASGMRDSHVRPVTWCPVRDNRTLCSVYFLYGD